MSVPATARIYKGSSSANKVTGTKKADKITLRGGNDRARGRGGPDRMSGGGGRDRLRGDSGRDRLNGGKGNDRLNGGKGKDRLAGGAGNDVLNSADGRLDGLVDGGAGRNTCRVDAADLKVTRRCSTITIVRAAPGGPGSGGNGAPGGAGAGAAGPLTLSSATGLSCASTLPTCQFELSGSGADTLAGTVSGDRGAQPAAGAGVAVSGDDWTARGTYGCTSNGSLVVTIGEETLRVPVSCGT